MDRSPPVRSGLFKILILKDRSRSRSCQKKAKRPDRTGLSNTNAELRRVSRQWQNLKYRKWFWLLDNEQAGRGEMALFCAACPQNGINLPVGWQDDFAKYPSVEVHELSLSPV